VGTQGQPQYIKLPKTIMLKNSKLVARLVQIPPSPEHNLIFKPRTAIPNQPHTSDTISIPELIKSSHITGHVKYNAAKQLLGNENKFWSALRKWLLYVNDYGIGVEGQNGNFLSDSEGAPLEDVLLVAELFGATSITDIIASIARRDSDLEPSDYL
jgi:hypothetical protein